MISDQHFAHYPPLARGLRPHRGDFHAFGPLAIVQGNAVTTHLLAAERCLDEGLRTKGAGQQPHQLPVGSGPVINRHEDGKARA